MHQDVNCVFFLFLQGALNINDRTIPQPPILQLSVEKLSREGAYLMDAGSVSCVVVVILRSIPIYTDLMFLLRTQNLYRRLLRCCLTLDDIAVYLSGDVSVDWEELWAELY